MASQTASVSFRTNITENLEDPVSGELMKMAVTLVPCGHTVDTTTVMNILANNKLCPLDRKPIERYVPNYTVRHMVETNSKHPLETPPTEAAEAHFQKGKDLSDKGDYEGAIEALLKALQASPTYEKARAYLDFCLQRAPKPLATSPTPMPGSASSGSTALKETYLDLLIKLMENESVQSNASLVAILESQAEELMNQESEEMTSKQSQSYKWAQKLLVDQKVSAFVAKSLLQIHVQASPKVTPTKPLPSVPAASIKSTLPTIAFGAAEWNKYFGEVGEEPPLPADINQILESPCPFEPEKEVQETHLLTLIPKTVNSKPLNLRLIDELVQKPLLGNPTKFSRVTLGEYTDPSLPRSRWVLVTRKILQGSRNQQFERQKMIFEKNKNYMVPTVLELVVSVFAEYVKTGFMLYPTNPFSLARCVERYDQFSYLAVGGFSKEGLCIIDGKGEGTFGCANEIGMAAMRRLTDKT